MTNHQKKNPILSIILLIFAAVFMAIISIGIGGYFYYQNQNTAMISSSGDSSSQAFIIKSGEGPAAIAQNLQNNGLIKNRFVFRYLVKNQKLENKLHAGVFQISPAQTPDEIIKVLTTPPQEISITLLPGWRREEFASYLAGLELENFNSKEFISKTATLEGQLWADTYFIYPNASTDDIIKLLTSTFTKKAITPNQAAIDKSPHTPNEILTIASILQRESKTKDEMKMIAGIIENRLNIEMPLQFCATAQYASGFHPDQSSWWVEPSLADTQIVSPYNTYTTNGLPPSPIAAPGINAIQAALSPTDNDYFFYLHDSSGKIHYAKNNDQHNQNKEQFLRN